MRKTWTKRLLSTFVAVMMGLSLLPASALAAEPSVAQIGDTTYETLGEAITAANNSTDPTTIELLQSCDLDSRISILADRNVTITAPQNSGITVTDNDRKGVGLSNGSTLTIENITLNTNGQIYLNGSNGSLTFSNASLNMDGEMYQFNKDGYYCCAISIEQPQSALKFDHCNVNIKNYPLTGSAIRWNPTSNTYFVEIVNGTSFESSNCYAGFTGTLNVKVEDSELNVHNHRGNGANGSHYDINGSVVNFYDNGSHGLSTTNLNVTDSTVTASGNSYIGIAVAGSMAIAQDSVVTVTENAFGSLGYAAMRLYNNYNFSVDSTSKLYINNNYNTGLYVRQGNLTVADGAVLEITGNRVTNEQLDGYGGGLYVGYGANYDPTVVLPPDAKIYNNHATAGGDDIYVSEGVNGPSLTFGQVGSDWALDGDEGDCEHLIDGWYDDSNGTRWEAHAETEEGNHIVKFTEFTDGLATVTGLKALKAAHGEDAQDKTSYPGLDKFIVTDNSDVKEDGVAAGDTVNFKLTSNVPDDLTNYIIPDVEDPDINTLANVPVEDRGAYVVTIHDQMDDMLTNMTTPVVTLDREGTNDVVLNDSQYILTTSDLDDGCTFEISIDLVALYEAGVITDADIENATPIVVTYSATLSENATAGDYINTAWVTYPEGQSSESVVTVKTYGISIFKYDQSNPEQGLSGAEFLLYQQTTEGGMIEDSQVTVSSGEDGIARFDGLDAGTYYLKETKAPEGYVASSEILTITIPEDADGTTNVVSVQFANSPIPHTGGMGTAMFTVGGAAILAAAGALFVVSRRKETR